MNTNKDVGFPYYYRLVCRARSVMKGSTMTQELRKTDVDFEPVLWTAKDLMKSCGFSRSRTYKILHNPATPVVHIGGRVFVLRNKFIAELERSAGSRDHPIFDG